MTRIAELRIHGVSGTPPHEMLQASIDVPLTAADVVQVAGDDQTSFHQRVCDVPDRGAGSADGGGGQLRGGSAGSDHIVEAYNWGQLTSGTWRKALWLLLVPFGLVNAAHFTLPAPPLGRGARLGKAVQIICEAALRVLGLVLSLALTLAIAEALVDLLAWQWTALPARGSVTARLPDPRGVLLGALFLSAAIPLLALWFGGGQAPGAGEPVAPVADQPDTQSPATDRPRQWVGAVALARASKLTGREFDVGDPDIPTLRNIHLSADWATLALLGFSIADGGGGRAGFGQWLRHPGSTACLLVLVAALLAVVLIGNPHNERSPGRRMIIRVTGRIVVAGGAGVLLASLLAVVRARGIPRQTVQHLIDGSIPAGRGVLPGIADATFAALVAALAGIAVLAVACAALAATGATRQAPIGARVAATGRAAAESAGRRGPFGRYLSGMAAPVLASVGMFLGVGFGTGVVVALQQALRRTVGAGRLTSPSVYLRIAHAWGMTLVEFIVIGVVLFALKSLARNRFGEAVRLAHNIEPHAASGPQAAPTDVTGDEPGLAHPDDLSRSSIARVASAWWLARIKMHVEWIFATVAIFGLILAVPTTLAALIDRTDPTGTECVSTTGPETWRFVGALISCRSYGGPAFIATGSLVLLGLGAGLIYLGRKSLSDSKLRRSINVVWDIVAFWPRAAHPLVPPPYTAKALDQLRRRIYFYLGLCAAPAGHRTVCTCAKFDPPVDRVVLAAHSQGSLVALAAVAGLRFGSDLVYPLPEARPVRLDEIALLTFGSQLQLAYARGFPAYVNLQFLQDFVAAFNGEGEGGPAGRASPGRAPRWISLLRETDPIGGQVLSTNRSMTEPPTSRRLTGQGLTPVAVPDVIRPGGVRECEAEWRLLDPIPTDGETLPHRRILAHSGYFLDPAWAEALRVLRL